MSKFGKNHIRYIVTLSLADGAGNIAIYEWADSAVNALAEVMRKLREVRVLHKADYEVSTVEGIVSMTLPEHADIFGPLP